MNYSQRDIFSASVGIEVCPIKSWQTNHFIINVHYAGRLPSISYAFGLFSDGELMGVCTFGTPASSSLRSGICGPSYTDSVLELNRLCLSENKKNWASILVSRSLKMLPSGSVVVSYADTEQGHIGYVYQATNFIYCGLSAKRTDWRVKGKEHLHGQTIADEFRGVENRGKAIRDKYGDDFYVEDRSRKHRYVYLVGSKTWKRRAKKAIRYKIAEYPKEDK